MEWIIGSRGIGKTRKLVERMIENNIHHVFCANPERMRERIHLAGGRDIAVYHYSELEAMKELDLQNVAYFIDDMRELMKYAHPACKGGAISVEGE